MDTHESAQIIFHVREKTDQGNYNDSLYYSFEDWKVLTQEDLDKAVKARVDNWIAVVTNPPAPYVPSKEELEQAKQYILEQIAQVDAQKNELYPPKPISELTKEELAELKAKYQAELEAAQAKVASVEAVSISVEILEPIEEVVK